MDTLRNKIKSINRKLKFLPGQLLSEKNYLPGSILFIERGVARLLYKKKGKISTLQFINSGEFIGLASILRGIPCEEVRAAEEIVAWSITDMEFRQAIKNDKEIEKECSSYLWPAELLEIIILLEGKNPQISLPILKIFNILKNESCLISQNYIENNNVLDFSKNKLFLASKTTNNNIGEEILSEAILRNEYLNQKSNSHKVRIISFPSYLYEILFNNNYVNDNDKFKSETYRNDNSSEDINIGPDRPPVSQLEIISETRNIDYFVGGKGFLHGTLACFNMLFKIMKIPFYRDNLEKSLKDILSTNREVSLRICGSILSNMEIQVSLAKVPVNYAVRLKTPCMIKWAESFALIIRSNQRGIEIISPESGKIELSLLQIADKFPDGIEALFFDYTNTTPKNEFGPKWFLPVLNKNKNILIQVLAASFIVQLFTLANPLLIQVIIDKVINQRSLDTLQVLGIALIAVTLLEGTLNSLKTFLFAQTTNKIDQRLGAEIIDHLLRLPLNYFDKRPVGELSSRVSELEKIRNFLTSQALTTIIDGSFSVIYIVVMAIYSPILTLIALIVLPIQIGLTLLGGPLFRRQFRQSAEANAKTQSHLVEILGGIQTVKSQNIEMMSRWKWQDLYGDFIKKTFNKTIITTSITQTSNVLQKISQLLVLWVGTIMVLEGKLTLGQLIAFRIISGYVTGPLLRLSSIWQDIQELKISFERLADVVNTPQESSSIDKTKIPLPPIKGSVVMKNVNFSFNKGTNPILKNINLDIKAGEFIGIVGQSGSGKSTLTKLLTRLYSSEEGKILIDGYDINKVELYSLRRQIGIVPQDPLLFSGSILKNISLIQPEASIDEIVKVSKLSCAHDFIMNLDEGYSSEVGERGTLLSGGQKQRIAIARTLLSNPKLLIMDEATSALDYELERNICENFRKSLKNCTVLFVTHRLATVRQADTIVLMHQGKIAERGNYKELLDKKGRFYALSKQQENYAN